MTLRKGLLFLLVFAVLIAILAVGIHTLTQDNNLGTDFFIFWQAGRAAYLEAHLAIQRRDRHPQPDGHLQTSRQAG